MKAIQVFEKMAREMVGDGKGPNVFFVTVKGTVVLVTLLFDSAYAVWDAYPVEAEAMIEDRVHGTVCQRGIEEGRRFRIDDSVNFGLRK